MEYPSKIEKLFLLSAVGVSDKTEEPNETARGFKEKTKKYLWEKNWSPISMGRVVGGIGTGKWLDSWTKNNILIATEEEQKAIKDLIH